MNTASVSSKFFKTLAAGLLVLGAGAALADQKIVPAQSDISFTSRQMGVPVDGKFKKWDAQIAFDPKKPETGKVSFTIDTGSATFGAAETDAEVPKAAWFNVPKFPQATFQSSAIKAAGPGKVEVTGKLSIKGAVHDVVVPVTLTQAGATTTAAGSFTIKRLDFKIGEGEWADTSMVANDVVVKFKLAVTGVAPL
ncbi:YceI family protein [Ideonella azotifigens]|uniref:YceI family protein n=1 Tax=Ideonella azotifigens TaxID=513160 RepID=A0ABP3UVI1_9BURK|nr:YceI family protein [Ideonella azotifigens]MCD2339664.1 YceI family protein [Ideonella azotifigens]